MATVLIIGGSSGIGYQLSNKLADEGHNVIATFNETVVSSKKSNLKYYRLILLRLQDFFCQKKLHGLPGRCCMLMGGCQI